ncbi:hypothetical protein QTP70_000924 [Hemibagrus guttatus]|uniref:B30.2/SPRY domain-containing protein n=1 Tax=Hemibagrus guttatus TaxID=175788 RepID=A0AAE0UHQ6_9TELE|nr:hypothetical protein QTP70_000924 [Hemibagrus guttatus]
MAVVVNTGLDRSDFCYLTLDPNTTHRTLILSEKNRVVRYSERKQQYSDHPERFDYWEQVLCKESVCGRCYWEVERSGDDVSISVSYKDISRKGRGNECVFGRNNQSWSLVCSSSSLSFYHNNIKTDLRVPSPSRIGVYVDHSAGTLSFYSVSDTMKLLHRVHTTFTQPLYTGFGFGLRSYVRLCDPEIQTGVTRALPWSQVRVWGTQASGRLFACRTRPGTARRKDIGPLSCRPTIRRKEHKGPVQCVLGSSHGREPRRPKPWMKNMAFGTWNLTSLGEKEPELVREVERYRLEIVGLASTHSLGSGTP